MHITHSDYTSIKEDFSAFIDTFDPSEMDDVKDELLGLAATFGDISQLDELIQMGAMYNHIGHWKRSGGYPLFNAIRASQIEVVKHLLKKYPELVNERDYRADNSSYDGPLNAAVRTVNCEMVKLILDFGADINYYCTDDRTYCASAFYVAITTGRWDGENPNVDVVKLLIKRGASQDISHVGSEKLFSCVYDEEIAKFLLSKDFIPTPKDIKDIIRESRYMTYEDDADEYEIKMNKIWKMRHDLLVVHGYIPNPYSEELLDLYRDQFYPVNRLYDMIVMHFDGYLVVSDGNEKTKRFFTICNRLPSELQLVLSNFALGRNCDSFEV